MIVTYEIAFDTGLVDISFSVTFRATERTKWGREDSLEISF